MVRSLGLSLAFLSLPALAAAQDDDALKRRILGDVEKRLKAEEERLLRDIEKLLDEELKGAAPAPAEKKPAPKAEAPRKARGYLGVRPGDLDEDARKALGIKGGIRVVEVVPGGGDVAQQQFADAADQGVLVGRVQDAVPIMSSMSLRAMRSNTWPAWLSKTMSCGS